MASVKKLMLIPADEWARLLKKSGEKEAAGTRSVDIPVGEQLGSGERRTEEEENVEDMPTPMVPSSSFPFPSPSSPSGEEEAEKEGKGKGMGEEEGGDDRRYMEREDSGKENSAVDRRKNAGVWSPPGHPSDVSTSRKRVWINI